MRLALIGNGRWGKNIERTLNEMEVEFDILGRKDVVEGYDGVVIATPISTHADIAIPLIEKGIPLLIEKPMAANVAQARRIRGATGDKSIVHVGHIHLHSPSFKDIVSKVDAITSMFFSGLSDVAPRTDCSIFADWLPHPLSMALEIMKEEPFAVKAGEGFNEGVAEFRFRYGIRLFCNIKWDFHKKSTKLTIEGIPRFVYEAGIEKPLQIELQAFIDAIKKGEKDVAQVDLGVSIARLIAAAEESAANGGKLIEI